VRIPVVANGDIDSPAKALEVLQRTGADAIMIGRAAQGRPWIFREIDHFLSTGEHLPPPDLREVRGWLLDHLDDHHDLYGESTGVRSARKHLGWYARSLPLSPEQVALFRDRVNATTTIEAQRRVVADAFDSWIDAADAHHWKLAA
jgi:tRNA-dihydrouridine synthase B